MRGQVARRTVIHFGWDYDYEGWKVHPTTPPSPLLSELRDRCAAAAEVPPESLEQFLVARYPPGATIGWHRDAPMFGSPVVGVSLLSACVMKFRRKVEETFEVFPQSLVPRSLYLLGGAARTQWQHSIPPTKALRYSITMRTLRRTAIAGSLAVALLACNAETPQPRDPATPQRVLRVCSDPNNLPFSNRQQQGFENRIAELIANDLHAKVEYTWWAQRRGFLRNTLRAKQCDVVMGLPSAIELAATTRPYYRSTYVFVSKQLGIHSLDDPRLKTLRIGVQLIGDDGANAPPAHALASRGIVENVRGYTVYGDYAQPNPPARIIDAVASGEIDVAIVWGPLAGYFAKGRGLEIEPVTPQIDLPFLPFVYDISLGVRREDTALRQELDAILARRRNDIARILDQYGVPRT